MYKTYTRVYMIMVNDVIEVFVYKKRTSFFVYAYYGIYMYLRQISDNMSYVLDTLCTHMLYLLSK